MSTSGTASNGKTTPLTIQEQGSFTVGGVVVTTPGHYDPAKPGPAGQTLHGDHAYVFYQIPAGARRYPLAFLHGHLQFAKTWETTPDGREGYQNIFLRRGFGVYMINQPRRGNAGQSTLPTTLTATPEDQTWFNIFRVGIWPDFFPGVQFSREPETLNQYFRQTIPYTGPWDLDVSASATAALFDKIGPGFWCRIRRAAASAGRPHSRPPTFAPSYPTNREVILCFRKARFRTRCQAPPVRWRRCGVPMSEFMKFTKIPVMIYYGDYIPAEPVANPGQDQWRVRLDMARLWAKAVNQHGGDVTVVHLPDVGIRGNTHFPFSDTNNVEIADLMSRFLAKKGLD